MNTVPFFLAAIFGLNGCAHSGALLCTRNYIEIEHKQVTTMELDNLGNIIGQDVVQSSKQTVRSKLQFLCPVAVKNENEPPPKKEKGILL
ncbi:MAG: hypothetical protein CMJ20_06755 [Phycisphaeraceae bacterium]|nr:hypothetical protein [Phycisphaeraceae bacterium]